MMGLYPKAAYPYNLGLPAGPDSNVYFVDGANGDDDWVGTSPEKALATVVEAEGRCVANQHDAVVYLGHADGEELAAVLTWDKNYTHLIGACAPTRVAKRSRIFNETTASISPLVNITASGCIFKDLYVFQGVADAASLLNVQVTGERNYFENVHFAGGGHATQAVDGGASLALNGASECTFKDCVIGVDTIAAATGMAGVIVDSAATRNIFEDCYFTMYAGNAGAKFVEIVDSTGFDRYIIFKDCMFINDAVAYTMTEAFTVPSGMGSATHRIVLKSCSFLGVGDIEDNDRGIVFTDSGTYTAGGNSAIMAAVAAT